MEHLTISIFIISLLWLVTGSMVNLVERAWLTEPMIALLVGVMAGPVFHWVVIESWQQKELMEWGAKITVAMALMVAALRFKHSYLVNHKQMLSILTLGAMLLMFITSVLLTRYILGFNWPMSVLTGAIITPTDPVVSSSIISGKYGTRYLNNNIRSSIYFESGVNDGLAFPLVAIGWILLKTGHMDWHEWIVKVVLFENLLAVVAGGLLGYVAGKVMHIAHKKGLMTQKTLLSYSMGLGFLTLSFLEMLNMNGVIGVFISGLMFSRSLEKKEDLQEEQVQVAIERIVTIPMFFLMGLVISFEKWSEIGYSLLIFTIAVLLLRRLPALIILKPFLRQVSRWPRVLVLGWFGPIGVAALLYAYLTVEEAGTEDAIPVTLAVVAGSVIVHGITSYPFSKLYDQYDTDDVEGDDEEGNLDEE
jgi:sodium/hydrogen antiporter